MADPTPEDIARAYEACIGERKPKRRQPDFEMRVLPTEPRLQTGVATTEASMKRAWVGNKGRTNQAAAFLKRARKSDQRRRAEKASRKRNRKR